MADDIKIGIASETRAFEQGVKTGVVKPLESIEDAAEKVGKAGDKAGDELTKGLIDSQKQTKEFGRDFRRMADDIQDDSRTAARKVRDDFQDTTTRGKESLRELGNEGRANLSETLSSFDGTAQGFVDGLQGTFGGIVGSLPGIGLVAGAAGAAAIGLIGKAFEDQGAKAEELAERTKGAFEDMTESGKDYVSQDFVNQSIKETLADADKYKQARQDAKDLDLDISTILEAQAGKQGAVADVLQRVNDLQDGVRDKAEKVENAGKGRQLSIERESDALGDIGSRYDTIASSNETAAKKAQIYLDTTNQIKEGTKKVKDNIDAVPDKKTIKLDVDDSAIRNYGRTLKVPVEYTDARTGKKIT